MTASSKPPRRLTELLLPILVLTVLLAYTYARFFLISYIGFQFNGASGKIVEVYVPQAIPPRLEPGATLVAVNGIGWEELHEGFRANPLAEIRHGEIVSLEVRNPQGLKTVEWVAPGFNMPEFWTRMINTWPPAYAFWLAGTAVLLLVRPRNERWALLVAFNYVTAIWFTAGGLSSWGVLASSFIFRAGIWMSLPIYLHFHWNFPNRIHPVPRIVWISLYLIGFGGIIAQWFGWVARGAYFYAFLIAVGVSALILLGRYIWRPIERREIGLLFFATAVAFAPALAVALISGESSINPALPGLLFSIVALPGAYFYVVYRRQLGGMELRTNRLISLYLFAVLLITLALAIFPFFPAGLEQAGGAIVLTALATTLVTSLGFPPFQRFVERRLLRIPETQDRLLTGFAGQISTSISRQNLVRLLKENVLPTLLIRQSALLDFEDGDQSGSVVYLQGVNKSQLPKTAELNLLMASLQLGKVGDIRSSAEWVRLAVLLRVGGSVRGLWLLGRKDPDDLYHENERALLASLADQMAIALTNISQAHSLRALHKADIERQEAERIHLARELHDDVLPRINELGNLTMNAANLNASIDQLIAHIRRTMAGLRPPLLDQGLYLALEQFAEELSARLAESTQIVFRVPSYLVRFEPAVEQHFFRIIQQACENALSHGAPKTIIISGKISDSGVDLQVEDDGSGFKLEDAGLGDLLKNRHFGLAGMSERAAMIGATLTIDSTPGKGTKVNLVWKVGNKKTES